MAKLNRHDLHYLLGFGFLNYHHKDGDNNLILSKPHRFKKVMEDLSFSTCGSNRSISTKEGISLVFNDEEIVTFLRQNGVTTPKRYMPSISDEYVFSFIAGYF